MHILILPSWYPTTYDPLLGVFFKEQAEALVKQGMKVGLIALQDVGIRNIIHQKKFELSSQQFVDNGVHTYRLQYLDIIKNERLTKKFKMFFFKRMFQKYIEENGLPDVVHLHSFLAGDLALYVKQKYNVPYVVTEHISGFIRNTIAVQDLEKARNIFEHSEYNIAVSEPFSELMQNKFTLPFSYIANIVNIDFFTVKKSVKKDIFDFIHVAHLDKNKNQAMLIRSFTHAFKNNAHVKLTIAGHGVEYGNLNSLVKKLNMQDQITLFGRASREEVKRLLQNSEAFVLSSKYETFGVVAIEAMACGLPVLATKCGGPESIVNSENVGLLSAIDESEFSKKLLEMYSKRKTFDSDYIRKYVEENFSEKAISLKLEDLYTKVINGNL